MKKQSKYLVILSAPCYPKEQFLTDDASELLDRMCPFRQETHPHRVEVYTAGEPGYEWWDDDGYHFVDRVCGTDAAASVRESSQKTTR